MTNTNNIKATILIASEKPDRDNNLAGLIRNKNITISRVESGNEALNVFQTKPTISLFLIDAVLPGMNGFDTTREIRRMSPTVPIILFVNYTNMNSFRLSTLVGCTRMLQNPFDPDELETIVNQYLPTCDHLAEPSDK